mgnify:CR=1 FL=1
MARLNQTLSIVIPTINEASRLPLLLADLNRWPHQLEVCICDSCSSDLTVLIAELAGAKVTQVLEANRGIQLHSGSCCTSGNWILFLHADCRMPKNWAEVLKKKINDPTSKSHAWFFDFKVQSKSIEFTLLEILVNMRSNLFKRPYGDQGLLINRYLYNQIGGYRPLHIMEDLDLIERLSKKVKLRSLGIPLYVDNRRWENINIINQAWKNASLRQRWRAGASSKSLSIKYYRE